MGRQSLLRRAALQGVDDDGAVPGPRERERAISQMTDELRQKFEELERTYRDLTEANLRYYHRIGKIVEEVISRPERYFGLDQTPGAKLLEQALSIPRRTVRRCVLFAMKYTERDLERLLSLQNSDSGFRLHWGHVAYLLSVEPAALRQEFEVLAVENSWDPGQLHEQIRRRLRRTGGHGRRHERPATLDATLRQFHQHTRIWVAKHESVWVTPAGFLWQELGLPGVENRERLETLEALERQLRLMQTLAGAAAEEARRLVEEYQRRLAPETSASLEVVPSDSSSSRRVVDVGDGAPRRPRRSQVLS